MFKQNFTFNDTSLMLTDTYKDRLIHFEIVKPFQIASPVSVKYGYTLLISRHLFSLKKIKLHNFSA